MVSPNSFSFQVGRRGPEVEEPTLDLGHDLPDYCSSPSIGPPVDSSQDILSVQGAQDPENTSSEYEPVLNVSPISYPIDPISEMQERMRAMEKKMEYLMSNFGCMQGVQDTHIKAISRLFVLQRRTTMVQEPIKSRTGDYQSSYQY